MNADRQNRDLIRSGIPMPILALMVAAGLSVGAASGALAQTDEWAAELETAPSTAPSDETPPETGNAAGAGETPGVTLSEEPFHYVAPLIDTKYSVGPAEFLGIDMPADPPGAKAVRLIGTIQVEGQGDIQVRLFRAADYQNWLKKRGGRKADPYWTSKRLRTINLDHPLTPGSPVVLVIDNGYSVRTPKRVKTLLQIQYERTGPGGPTTAASGTSRAPVEEDFIVPRGNTEEEIPPPPPPPSDPGAE